MELLILGGTRFVGRAIVEEALGRGHRLTLVHRGQTGDELFHGLVEVIHADRLASLDVLKGRSWDACIDTCAYVPRANRIAADALAGNVGHYAFISTISVYKDPPPGANEDSPLIEVGDPENEVIDGDSYGFLKVLCEREVVARFGLGSFIVRPGLVVGPNDPTDRFTYWAWRMATEKRVLVPADLGHFAQWIDARDLAALTVHGVEARLAGPTHAVGESVPFRMFLEEVRTAANPDCELVPLDLTEAGIQPWIDLPMVVPVQDGSFQLDPSKASAQGLQPRPILETVRDTLAWFRGQNREPLAGMDRQRHADILASLGSR